MNSFLKLIFGDPNKKKLKKLTKEIESINVLEAEYEALSTEELKAKVDDLKERVQGGESLDAIAYDAFAVVREAAKRTLEQRHYDVQLIGGLVLYRGDIAEMRTGEGKTLTSTLPIFLRALEGKGVHVVTVNDYLAKRDAVWMGQIFAQLGLTVGCIQQENGYLYDASFDESEIDEERDDTGSFKVQTEFLRPASRQEAYKADITYGTNNQFGFDYLRDNMVMRAEDRVQRGLHYAIIDEVDSILIDEARTPLIISAPAEQSADLYYKFAKIVETLKEGDHYNVDEKMKVATFSEDGVHALEEKLGISNLYSSEGYELIHYADQALRAKSLYEKDKQYVVQNGEVQIVDEFTGRIMEGRRYSEGLHQAIEAKEGVEIKEESRTLATITFQNFFKMYTHLAGMTGTGITEAEEFGKIYDLEVVVVPTHRPIAREDASDKIFRSKDGKLAALARDVAERQAAGQPVLIGTASIEENELVSQYLTKAGIEHEMLNAKNHEREAQIIAQAGTKGAVTVATNMAGRGVDIKLGGNPGSKEMYEEVKALGGLCVFGTERHEARRIDNQLRGRAGRQGDPGYTQFYVSVEDDLMRIFGGDRLRNVMNTLNVPEDQHIESKMISNSLEKAQQRVEGHHFDARKRVLEYDEVLNKHRKAMYERRLTILADESFNAEHEVIDAIEREVERVILFHTGGHLELDVTGDLKEERVEGDIDSSEILEVLETIMPLSSDQKNALQELIDPVSASKELLAAQRSQIIDAFIDIVRSELKRISQEFEDDERMSRIVRTMLLRSIDNAWVQHLETMKQLRQSIGLRGYAQRNPLVEYNREAFHIFNAMNEDVEKSLAYNAFKVLRQALTATEVTAAAPSLIERAKVVLQGAQKTMERGGANSAAGQSRAARRAAAKLVRQAQPKGPSDDKRAKLRKKRK
jgi:preprotein translocase subunit SecA